MILQIDFEALHGTILHCNILPSIDLMANELLVEDIQLKSQARKGIVSTPPSFFLAIPSKPPPEHLLRHLPIIKTSLTQGLSWMNVAIVSKRVIRRLNVR